MKSNIVISFIFFAFIVAARSLTPGGALAQSNGPRTSAKGGDVFVDNDGDGYNDNAPDDDGDGIPNGKDPDYVKPADGSKASKGKWFIDEDGDGISDIAPGLRRGAKMGLKSPQGKPNETSNQNIDGPKGIQNAILNGLKKGQNEEAGNGLWNALERGRKIGQLQSGEPQETTLGSNSGTTEYNGKNRFGRELLNSNKNFNIDKKTFGPKEDAGKNPGPKK